MLEIQANNFIITIQRDDESELSIWCPQPLEKEVVQISRILSYIYKEIRSDANNIQANSQVAILDWERLVDEALASTPNNVSDAIRNALNSYIDRACAGAFCQEGDFNSLSDAEKSIFKGTLLFTSALYRYLGRSQAMKSEMKHFFTSLNAMEWRASLQKSTGDSQTDVKTKIGSSVTPS